MKKIRYPNIDWVGMTKKEILEFRKSLKEFEKSLKEQIINWKKTQILWALEKTNENK